jgi:hypothetical protein
MSDILQRLPEFLGNHLVLTLANSAGSKEADITIKAGERNEMQLP